MTLCTPYDKTGSGGHDGTVQRSSARTAHDVECQTVDRAQITLATNYVSDESKRNRVLPGMELIADIKTGKKTLLEFLLKPVVKALSESFRER